MATRLADIGSEHGSNGPLVLDDRDLVLAFQSGDADAYADIYLKYRTLAAQICYRMLQDRDDAEEAVQETMLRVYRGLPAFNGRYQLQAWVARIATNVSLDAIRARARRPQPGPAIDDLGEDGGSLQIGGETTDDEFERIVDQEQVRAILSAIPEHHRDALVLREFEGRTHEEIGFALGVSPQQAKALIHRAKRSFRRKWDENGERRGIAALAPFWLAPFRLPGLLRRVLQPAHDAMASVGASAQQAAAQVGSSPVVSQTAVSAADKVTAAALTVIVAGTVGVGAVAIRHHSKPSKPSPSATVSVAPSPAPAVAPVAPEESRKPIAKAHTKKHHKAKHLGPAGGGQGSPAPTTTESPSPSSDPSASPSPDPSQAPTPPPPPPPAPDFSMTFDSSIPVGKPDLALVNSRVAPMNGGFIYSQTVAGSTTTPGGKPFGRVYIDYFGQVEGASSLLTIWLFIDTPAGTYHYEASGTLVDVVMGSDGTTTYSFRAPYHLVDGPVAADGSIPTAPMPNQGQASLTMKFWVDGSSLYASGLSLQESPAA